MQRRGAQPASLPPARGAGRARNRGCSPAAPPSCRRVPSGFAVTRDSSEISKLGNSSWFYCFWFCSFYTGAQPGRCGPARSLAEPRRERRAGAGPRHPGTLVEDRGGLEASGTPKYPPRHNSQAAPSAAAGLAAGGRGGPSRGGGEPPALLQWPVGPGAAALNAGKSALLRQRRPRSLPSPCKPGERSGGEKKKQSPCFHS